MRAFILFLLIPLSLTIQGQGFRVRHYLPNAGNNSTKTIFESNPGNYITSGFVVETQNNQNYNRLCIMGLDAQGQIIWIKKYGRPQLEYLSNSLISRCFYKNGNYLCYVGCVRDSLNNQQGVLIKFDLNGDTLWQKIYRDVQEDVIPQMVTVSVDGGFLITGFFQNWTNNTNACMLIKTDANGNELWRKKINKVTPNTHDGKAIVQDPVSKKIAIVGYQYIGNANSWGNHENVLILDSLGIKLSQHTYAGSGLGGVFFDLIRTQDGMFVAAGIAIYPQTLGGFNLNKSYIVKFDINAPENPVWIINDFGRLSLTNAFHCLKELPNGEILVGGVLDTLQVQNINPNTFIRLTKINPNGNVTWSKNYDYKTNSPTSDNLLALISLEITNNGSWIAAIERYNFPSPNPFFFVEYDSTGCDSTLAYCQSIGQGTVSGVYKNNLKDLRVEVFPNPVKDRLNIRIDAFVPGIEGATNGDICLKIADVSGREVKHLKINGKETMIDLKDLSNGVYILSLSRNKELIYTKKLVKQE